MEDDFDTDDVTIAGDAFLNRVMAGLDEAGRRRLEVMRRVNGGYLKTRRDDELDQQVRFLIEGAAASTDRANGESRILLAIGEARVGKTAALARALGARAEFQKDGDWLPFVAFTAPNPCGHKQLGREFLRALGYDLEADIPEHMVWEKVRKWLRKRRTRFVWIDEMHHAMRGTDIQKLRDTVKNTMQPKDPTAQNDWVVSFILSGIPLLSNFVTHDFQILGRKRVVNFNLIEFPRHAKLVRWAATTIVVEHAGLKAAADIGTDEFVNRLCHAACNRFGLAVIITRSAVEMSLDDPNADGTVGLVHFAKAYRGLAGCDSTQNVFTAAKWHEIRPENALLPEPPADEEPETTSRGKNKGQKS